MMKSRKVRVQYHQPRQRRRDSPTVMICVLLCLILCFFGTLVVVGNFAISTGSSSHAVEETRERKTASGAYSPEKIHVLLLETSEELLIDLSNADPSFVEITISLRESNTIQWPRGPVEIVGEPTLEDLTDTIIVLSSTVQISSSLHFLVEASKRVPSKGNIVGICADEVSVALPGTLVVASRRCNSAVKLTASGINTVRKANSSLDRFFDMVLERDLFFLFPGRKTAENVVPFPTKVTSPR